MGKMGKITVEMIRRRAEHNEGVLYTLEELVLQEEGIEKIELLGIVCPHLKILYMPNNLISKLENMRHLKDLQYLNLALNNITLIEGLEGCESLQKLDLTLNFVNKQNLHTATALRHNIHLTELYFTGNPCQDFSGYRSFVIATLPTLKRLDSLEITRSERRVARKEIREIFKELNLSIENSSIFEVDQDSEEVLVNEKGEKIRTYSPATRITEHDEIMKLREQGQESKPKKERKATRRRGFDPLPTEGRIYQKNEGGWRFKLAESTCRQMIVLDVDVSRFLDTSLIDVDVQPTWVRVLIKGKLLQLQLPAEVKTDASMAQRSALTGNLVITMPKIKSSIDALTFIEAAKEHTSTKSSKVPKDKVQAVNIHNIVDQNRKKDTIPRKDGVELEHMEDNTRKRETSREPHLFHEVLEFAEDLPPLE